MSLYEFYQSDTNGDKFLFYLYTSISSKLAIISLSENEYSPLMWPHYTQEKGFQVNFNTALLERSIKEISFANCISDEGKTPLHVGINSMNYVEKLKPLEASGFFERNTPSLLFNILFNRKHINWKYENEWRLLVTKPYFGIPFSKFYLGEDWNGAQRIRNIDYSKDAIRSITIGRLFFNSTIYVQQPRIESRRNLASSIFSFKEDCKLNIKETSQKRTHLKLIKYLSLDFTGMIYMSCHKSLTRNNRMEEVVRAKQQIQIHFISDNTIKIDFSDNFLW